MEFSEKLQHLRKSRDITQEELAAALYVSRTAVSKWESGRGYPSIDSLKAIAAYFSVTVDELLSGEEILSVAEEDGRRKTVRLRELIFALLDVSAAMLLFLPIFGQTGGNDVNAVSLLTLDGISQYLKIVYLAAVGAVSLWGVVSLALYGFSELPFKKYCGGISLLLSGIGVLLFIISPQPYAGAIMLIFLAIKAFLLLKKP